MTRAGLFGGVGLGATIGWAAATGSWRTVLRRPLVPVASAPTWFLLLFIPIAWKMGDVYSWVSPHGFNAEQMKLLEHKRPFLNVPFFLIRTFIYLLVASVIGRRLFNL